MYGIDMPSPTELVAHGRTEEEVAKEIGVDLVIYQTLDDLVQSCRTWNPSIETFDCSVFTGEYVTGGVDERYLEHLQKLRSDNAKAKKKGSIIQSEEPTGDGCSGPMSESTGPRSYIIPKLILLDGAESLISRSDSLIGLSNHSPKLGPQHMGSPNDSVGLHNSWYGA